MVRVQHLTSVRPGEVCRLRPCDLDRSGEPWIYSPIKHKTKWRKKKRLIPVGPKARDVLSLYLDRESESHCFSPRERMEQRREEMRKARKSKVPPSQESRTKRRPKRVPREFYTTSAYDKAILAAIRKENKRRETEMLPPIPEWSPNQLRHSAGTTIRANRAIHGIGNVPCSTTLELVAMSLNQSTVHASPATIDRCSESFRYSSGHSISWLL